MLALFKWSAFISFSTLSDKVHYNFASQSPIDTPMATTVPIRSNFSVLLKDISRHGQEELGIEHPTSN